MNSVFCIFFVKSARYHCVLEAFEFKKEKSWLKHIENVISKRIQFCLDMYKFATMWLAHQNRKTVAETLFFCVFHFPVYMYIQVTELNFLFLRRKIVSDHFLNYKRYASIMFHFTTSSCNTKNLSLSKSTMYSFPGCMAH